MQKCNKMQQGKHSARKPPKLIILVICKTSSQAPRCTIWKVHKLRSSQAKKLTSWHIDRLPDWQDEKRTEWRDDRMTKGQYNRMTKVAKSCQMLPKVVKNGIGNKSWQKLLNFAKRHDDMTTWWHYGTMARWHDDTMTRWHDDTLTRWRDDAMTQWHDDTMTRWHDDTLTRGHQRHKK